MKNKLWNVMYLEIVMILRSGTDDLIQVLGSLMVVFGFYSFLWVLGEMGLSGSFRA